MAQQPPPYNRPPPTPPWQAQGPNPPQPRYSAPPPKKRPRWLIWVIVGVAAVIVISVLGSLSGSGKKRATVTPASAGSNATVAPSAFPTIVATISPTVVPTNTVAPAATAVPTPAPIQPTATPAALTPTATVPAAPTALPTRPAATAIPATAPAQPSSGAFQSNGIGLSRSDWEKLHGPGIGDASGANVRYENDKFLVTFLKGNVVEFIRQYGNGNTVPLDLAVAESKGYLPADARFVRTYTSGGDRVDVYESPSLATRYPADPANFPWGGEKPGTFIVLFQMSNGRVNSLSIGAGNNP